MLVLLSKDIPWFDINFGQCLGFNPSATNICNKTAENSHEACLNCTCESRYFT
jgi:hypothetical protein